MPAYTVPLDRTANVPLSEGVHPLKITAGEEGEGAKGPYWKFDTACLTPGEEGKSPKPLYISLAPQSRWKLEIFLDAVGAPTSGAATVDKFVGRQFRGQIKHETYEGRIQAVIGEMFPRSGGTAAESVVKKAAVVVKAAAPAKAVSKGLPEDTVPADDDAEPAF
jgi:hypothetical protein